MENQRRRDTGPELALRRELWQRGLRYRVDVSPLPALRRRRADLVFFGARVAVFVDGCFWHGCPAHGTLPKSNRSWWRAKIAANARRDQDTDRLLEDGGWLSIRVWEHESPTRVSGKIERLVRRRAARREVRSRQVRPLGPDAERTFAVNLAVNPSGRRRLPKR
jgi:DNA mismatch endonuclease, patch repair protein